MPEVFCDPNDMGLHSRKGVIRSTDGHCKPASVYGVFLPAKAIAWANYGKLSQLLVVLDVNATSWALLSAAVEFDTALLGSGK